MKSCWWKGGCPGVETVHVPDVLDALDAGDVVEGVGRRLASSVVGWW